LEAYWGGGIGSGPRSSWPLNADPQDPAVSKFEFVSVALALVYSFAAARLLAALPWVVNPERRYWVHSVWFCVVMLALAVTWWQVWLLREVAWNAIRFVWALAIPSLIYLRAGALVSQDPEAQTSWREHYFRARVPFFGIGIAIALNTALVPWVMGVVPWFELGPAHVGSGILLLLYSVGLASRRPSIHGALAIVNLALLTVFLIASSWREAAAA